jgi:hypothetical protein
VIDQVGGVMRSTLEAATPIMNALREAGIETIDQVRNMVEKAKLGDQYRSDLIADALKEGVRAEGSTEFDNDRWVRTLNAASIDDIKAYRNDFAKRAQDRLGEGGRQTEPGDPNRPNIRTDAEFDKLPKDEQDKKIREFLERTGGVKK